MPKPPIEPADGSQNGDRAITVLKARDMHNKPDEMASGIGDNVMLAAVDSLASVIATRTATFRGFHQLAIDDTGRRARLTFGLFPRCHDQDIIDHLPSSIPHLLVKVILNSRISGNLFW